MAAHHPNALYEHKHRELLLDIVQQIQNSAFPHIYMYKVKSHIGIVGNEYADKLAKKAAIEGCTNCINIGDNPYNNRYWMYHEGDNSIKCLGDMGHSLKKVLHPQHKLGNSNQASIYFQSWRKLCNNATGLPWQTPDGATSNGFMSSDKVSAKERKHTLQYRTGTLPNNKFLYRCKLSRHCQN